MLPAAARLLMKDVPELAALGCDRRTLWRRLGAGLEIPAGTVWLEADPLGPR
jgi:hypothetical protein